MTFAMAPIGGEGFDGRTKVTVGQDHTAWLSSPMLPSSFRHGTGYHGLHVTIPRSAMETALAVLGGRPQREVLRFDSRLSLRSGSGASLQRLIRFVTEEVDRDDAVLSSPLIAARFADSVLFAMLLGQPNNHGSSLHATPVGSGPRHVQRAAEYLAANAHRPIRMGDLAALTGVSARTLQVGFLKHRGCTPMEFLRDRRLELARAKLMTSNAAVTQVALECGFLHLGRFSVQYRARFGEPPSATRARANV